jgi:uncharacterized protein YdeI (YjbR/CyaY-like superfamily)
MSADDAPSVLFETRDAWRAWLEANHATATGVWHLSWRPGTGRGRVAYEEAVEEALCFGWIDSKGGNLDDERSRQYYAPRNPRSGWARSNKERVERLTAEGRMAPSGLAAIERAKENGAWTMLDDVENLLVPDDLAAAFALYPRSAERWAAFPKSVRRMHLEWIVQARRPATRAARIEAVATHAARNERANERPRD